MNIPEILDQYPKARNAWEKRSYGKTHEMISSFVEQHIELSWGVFLRFFDEQGIYIHVEYWPASSGEDGQPNFWTMIISDEYEVINSDLWDMTERDTREAAQLAALTAALTILEGRL